MIRKTLTILLLSITSSVFAFSVGGAESERVGASSEPITFRVMSYNIHHGRGMDDRVDLKRIADLILNEKPDFVGLQEVDRDIPRSGSRDLTEVLAELTELTGYFESNLSLRGGEYGNAWLSRYPIVEKANFHFDHLHDGEQRGLLQSVVDVKGKKLLLLNTHLSHRGIDAEDRVHSIDQALEIIGKKYRDLPVVFIGDFNDSPTSALYKKMEEKFVDAWATGGEGSGFTYPADKPDRRIDYIWIDRENGLKPIRAWVPETLASDHRPVVAEIEWNP